MDSLTTHLLSHNPSALHAATHAPFLSHAGTGRVPPRILERWLADDRLYALAYVRFAALLLANVRLVDEEEGLDERLADLALETLVNLRRELRFFKDVATRYHLNLNLCPLSSTPNPDQEKGNPKADTSDGVSAYRSLFHDVGSGIQDGSLPLLDGFVLLWATEKVYLDAWRYAASFSSSTSSSSGGKGEREDGDEDQDGGALRKEFIPNWSSEEFGMFVQRAGGLLDELWVREVGGRDGDGRVLERVVRLWERVVEVERVFWPVMDG